MTTKGLTIIIPAYNEKNSIILTIEQVLEIMDKSKIIYELIVVNDGSTDGTRELVEKYIYLSQKQKNYFFATTVQTKAMAQALKPVYGMPAIQTSA